MVSWQVVENFACSRSSIRSRATRELLSHASHSAAPTWWSCSRGLADKSDFRRRSEWIRVQISCREIWNCGAYERGVTLDFSRPVHGSIQWLLPN